MKEDIAKEIIQDSSQINLKDLLLVPKDGKGKNCIHFATARGDLEILKYLLQETGPEGYECKDNGDNVPLHIAVQHRHKECVRMLLEKTSASVERYKKVQPLHLAASVGDIEIAEILINEGADINAQDEEMGSPLNYSICYGEEKCVKFFLSRNAKIVAMKGLPHPVHLAINFNHKNILDLLYEQDPECVKELDGEGYSALHLAAELGSVDICKKIAEIGVDPNYENQGKTALQLAIEK